MPYSPFIFLTVFDHLIVHFLVHDVNIINTVAQPHCPFPKFLVPLTTHVPHLMFTLCFHPSALFPQNYSITFHLLCQGPSHGGSYMDEGMSYIRIGLLPHIALGDCLASVSCFLLHSLSAC